MMPWWVVVPVVVVWVWIAAALLAIARGLVVRWWDRPVDTVKQNWRG